MITGSLGQGSSKNEESKRKITKQQKITCIKCSATLGTLIETDRIPTGPIWMRNKKHTFTCCCGGESLSFRTEMDCYFLADEKYQILDLKVQDKNFMYTIGKYNGTDTLHTT